MSKDTESLREILGDAIKQEEDIQRFPSPLVPSDLKNLRFCAGLFREYQWQTPWIHWGVFEQTLYELADRAEELERRFKEEAVMRDRYKARANSWRNKALELADELARLKAESACPCCRGSESLQPCEECKGTGLASVAYDTCRIHFKLLKEDCEKAIQNLNRFARCTIGEPTPQDCEWAREWLKSNG